MTNFRILHDKVGPFNRADIVGKDALEAAMNDKVAHLIKLGAVEAIGDGGIEEPEKPAATKDADKK